MFCGPLFVEEARDNSKMCRGESELSITALERGVFVAVCSCFMQSGFLVKERGGKEQIHLSASLLTRINLVELSLVMSKTFC